ncbi:malonic semialdehyde reductase [Solicola sp. PLA-1-18]|uniref:malonic semialdehyde reductase n=1 Tax=Solicola sp. PLA-1-18 TaxID=3380532 RepID=UPI003B7B88C0
MTSTIEHALSEDARDLLFRDARTANTFTDEPVSVEQVREVYELTKFGPTAANTQPLRMLVVGPESRERLLPHMSDGNRAKTAAAPMVVVLAADVDFHDRMGEVFPHNPGARDWWPDADSRARAAVQNASIQAGYFITGVRAVGLSAGPMGGFDKPGLDADLLAGTTWRSQIVVNIGHPGPDAFRDRLPRLPFADVARVL